MISLNYFEVFILNIILLHFHVNEIKDINNYSVSVTERCTAEFTLKLTKFTPYLQAILLKFWLCQNFYKVLANNFF